MYEVFLTFIVQKVSLVKSNIHKVKNYKLIHSNSAKQFCIKALVYKYMKKMVTIHQIKNKVSKTSDKTNGSTANLA